MENLIRITQTEQGQIDVENFDELKEYIRNHISVYGDVIYEGESIAEAKKDRTELNRLKSIIDNQKSYIRHDFKNQSGNAVSQLDELSAMINKRTELIREFIVVEEEEAKKSRRCEIECFYRSVSAPLGEFAEDVWKSPAFYENKWNSPNYPQKFYKSEIKRKIIETQRGLSLIRYKGGKYTAALIDRYISTLTSDDLDAYRERLENIDVATSPEDEFIGAYNEDNVRGYKTIKFCGTEAQFNRLLSQFSVSGIEYTVIEDMMPREGNELCEPDFDSFVAFDIETSGSFGISAGDMPPEIIEIGAVKVVGGVIEKSFSMLCNPGRSIMPVVEELTGITNEMVADMPSVGTVVKAFIEFAGDSVIVGHGIRNCDLIYIKRAAKRIGIVLQNHYFDTYRYAERVKEEYNLSSLKLESIASSFGIQQTQAHRALCDAEATAGVYIRFSKKKKPGTRLL